MLDLQRISGASFFDRSSDGEFYLEDDFVPFDQSIIWKFNDFFWQNVSLWEKTFGENYESSIPGVISESHKDEFIYKSAKRFFELLVFLHNKGSLPKEIIVLEQGPGSGIYALGFLSYISQWSQDKYDFLEKITYVLCDTSKDILDNLKIVTKSFSNIVNFYLQKEQFDVPAKYAGKVLLIRHGNLWDQLPCKIVRFKDNIWLELFVRSVSSKPFLKEPFDYIKNNPVLWKDFYQNIFLEEKWVETKEYFFEVPDGAELISSIGVEKNLNSLIPLINWQGGGYIEVVDIVVPSLAGFINKNRRPKKYDGGIGVVVNGQEINKFLEVKGFKMDLERLEKNKINMIATIKPLL